MSRLMISNEHLPAYMNQLSSIVSSVLCDHTTMKCVDNQFIACPIRVLEELSLTHPYHSLVMQTLETFHRKYHGCSCKSLLFFLTRFYHQLQAVAEKNIFNYLEELIDQSKSIAEKEFAEKLSIDSNLFTRICRSQTIYSDSLYQAYRYFTSFKPHLSHSELLLHFQHLTHVTRVKYVEEKCVFIPGTILTTNQLIEGCRRTILIDGYLLEDYVHLGYNNKIKLKQTSRTSSWNDLIGSILNEYTIEVILCAGTIDERLKSSKIVGVENIPTKTLRLLGENAMVNYLTDLTEENILLLNYQPFPDDPALTIIDKGATIIQYVPLQSLVDVQHERFVHCLGRLCQILQKNFYLNGSGAFEARLYRYWYDKKENFSFEFQLAYDCFLQCLHLFLTALANRRECFEENLIDDFDSKFDAWQSSIELLKILHQIDTVIEILPNEDISDL